MNLAPFLLIEIGYNRVTGWMVHLWDSSGGSMKNALEIFSVQCETGDFSTAIEKINEYIFAKENKGKIHGTL